jgi:DNA-binding NarL/FixJ family response regulator
MNEGAPRSGVRQDRCPSKRAFLSFDGELCSGRGTEWIATNPLEEPMGLRVVLADDHQVVREGFRVLLERAGFEVTAEASDGWDAVRLVEKCLPDVAILDVSMPMLNGLDAAREILARTPKLPVVLLTVHTEEHLILSALRAGVRGYIIKTQAANELLAALHEVLAGGTYLSPKVSGIVVQAYFEDRTGAADPLTLRDREVLQLVAEGSTTKEIGAALDLSVKTAEYYRSRVMSKLGIHTTAGLVRYAIRHGVVELAAAACCRLLMPHLTPDVIDLCGDLFEAGAGNLIPF